MLSVTQIRPTSSLELCQGQCGTPCDMEDCLTLRLSEDAFFCRWMAVLGNRIQILVKSTGTLADSIPHLTLIPLSLLWYPKAFFLKRWMFHCSPVTVPQSHSCHHWWSSSTSLKLHTLPCRLQKSVWRSPWSAEQVQDSSFQKRCYIAHYLLQTIISSLSFSWAWKGQ